MYCRSLTVALLTVLTGLACAGCGTMVHHTASEQLLASQAVDEAIGQIDFTPMSGCKVFLDSQYLQTVNGVGGIGFVNAPYIISSLRQQMIAAGLLIQDQKEQAEFVLEARVGTLGADRHDLVYGIPSNSTANATAMAVSVYARIPLLPSVPEVALARKNDEMAAAKIAVFAYDRQTRQRVWQSGVSTAKSNARNSWFMGAGPFQKGRIHTEVTKSSPTVISPGAHLAGRPGINGSIANFDTPVLFESHLLDKPEPHSIHNAKPLQTPEIQQASGEAAADLDTAPPLPEMEPE